MTTESKTAEPLRIKVLAERLDDAKHELDKLVRKAHRFGCPEVSYSISEVFQEEREVECWSGAIRKFMVDFHWITLEGAAPKAGHFEFIAKLEHSDAGVIVDMVPGATGLDRRFYTERQSCEHCKTRRYRKHTFVVRDRETGRQVQVGHNCIHDFLGVNLANVLYRFGIFRAFGDLDPDERFSGGWRVPDMRNVEDLLTLGHVLVELFGYASKGTAEATGVTSTSAYVHQMFITDTRGWTPHMIKELAELKAKVRAALKDSHKIAARETKAWAAANTVDSEYMHNLRILCAAETIPAKRQGYVVSAISAHAKAIERELRLTETRKAAALSNFVGQEGERLKGLDVIFQSARVIGGNQFADCCLWKFTDEAGNVFSWFTGKGTAMKPGQRFRIDATVKAHREYKGNKETQLTRCKVLAPVAA